MDTFIISLVNQARDTEIMIIPRSWNNHSKTIEQLFQDLGTIILRPWNNYSVTLEQAMEVHAYLLAHAL